MVVCCDESCCKGRCYKDSTNHVFIDEPLNEIHHFFSFRGVADVRHRATGKYSKTGGMDMSLREWLVLIGVIVIIGVIIDGYRRMRLARKRSSELAFGIEDVKGNDGSFSSELPNGGARRTDTDTDEFTTPEMKGATGSRRVRRDDRSSHRTEHRSEQGSERIEPDFGSGIESGPKFSDSVSEERDRHHSMNVEEVVPVLMNVDQQEQVKAKKPKQAPGSANDATLEKCASASTTRPSTTRSSTTEAEAWTSSRPAARQQEKDKEKLPDKSTVDEVIAINVLAKSGVVFDGSRLLQSCLGAGLKFGDRSIFHRHSNKDGSGRIQFSLANGVKPGTFDIEQLESTQTTIVSLFLCLPGPEEPLKAFGLMEETARNLALDLGGELKDENFSVMTQQTLEHCRQCIRDHERKQLTIKQPH